jgi:F-type H+-transporting ATPase subunit delta
VTAFARSYAQAFLQAAPKDYDVERFLAGAAALRDALAEEASLKAFLSSPAVPLAAKSGALAKLTAKAGMDAFGTRLLNLALARGRILGLSEILSAIREQSDRASGVVAARVTVAAPVDEAERARIADGLARSVKRRVRLKVDVDETILGGFVAQVGSEVFDASVRHAVERFQKQMKENSRT